MTIISVPGPRQPYTSPETGNREYRHHAGFHHVPACELHKGDRLLIAVDEQDRPLTVCKVLGVCVAGDTVEVALPALGWRLPTLSLFTLVEVADGPLDGAV